jgi:hypothetical protein
MESNLLRAMAAAGLAALSIASGTILAKAESPTRVKIGSAAHRENGCGASYKSVKIAVPQPERLDLDYKGVIAGIERVYTEGNGTRSETDYAFVDNGASLSFQLFAKGGGTRLSVFGRSWCQGASGANITVDIYAHYKR